MIETLGLGAGSYPEPTEKKEKEKDIKIYITLKTTDVFPEDWNDEHIKDFIKDTINEYINTCDIEIEEIEV